MPRPMIGTVVEPKHSQSLRFPRATEALLMQISKIYGQSVTQSIFTLIHETATRMGLYIGKDGNVKHDSEDDEQTPNTD